MVIDDFMITKEADELFKEITLESARGEEMKEVGLNLQNLKKFKLFKADTCQICDIQEFKKSRGED